MKVLRAKSKKTQVHFYQKIQSLMVEKARKESCTKNLVHPVLTYMYSLKTTKNYA